MKNPFQFLGWTFGLLFFLLFLFSLYSKNWLPSIPVLIIALLFTPLIRKLFVNAMRIPLPVWLLSILIPILFILFIVLIFMGMGNRHSIYKSPEIEARLMEIYDSRIKQWPVPYETRYIQTQYGKVFVIVSGPEDAPPVMLLHASSMASWSWLYNIEGMNRHYRTYAIDTIGDAGKSKLDNMEAFPGDGKALAELYTEIMDKLGVEKACFIGASQGGFITTNMAIYAPERVEKIILSGPMGYTGTNTSVLRILFTTMFPAKPIRKSAARWAFGNDPGVNEAVGEWFGTILAGVIPRQARPRPFTSEQFQALKVPVLLILGKRDGLVGNPENARKITRYIPDVRVEVLDAGHLISAERPEQFNELVYNFIEARS